MATQSLSEMINKSVATPASVITSMPSVQRQKLLKLKHALGQNMRGAGARPEDVFEPNDLRSIFDRLRPKKKTVEVFGVPVEVDLSQLGDFRMFLKDLGSILEESVP